jgi:RHS repeat-associated protein
MGWTRSKSINTGKHSETETFAVANLPAPWGTNTNSTGKVQTDIDGERTLVTDQSGKQRISKTNALGQLLNVWEVKESDADTEAITFGTSSLNALKTSYQYDTLNNLKQVNQGVQTRTFAYNSLSRLLSANNPESGLINYKYDENGNLTSKTDARSITTTYIYDVLNRVKNRNYSDNATPNVAYTYDNGTNAKGKLTKVTNGISTTEYTNFDILGRVLNHKQRTYNNDYTTAYTYNLSGALIEETYPSGRVVKNTLDNDGDLAQVQSKKLNDSFKNYANAFTYTSAGAVSSLRLGNGKFENTQFNSRLQPVQIGLGSSATSQNLLKLNFDYGLADNNGNVKSQIITTPTAGSATGFTATQIYAYDLLNRLKSAVETIPNQTGWKQTFIFDRYGNRTFDTANNNTTTLANGCPVTVCNPTANQNDNKLVGTNYDSVGNTKIDANGQVFTYDAENKQTKVVNAQGVTLGEYFYDGDGKRVKKVVPNGETTIFVYDAAGKTVAEYSTISVNQADAKINYTTTDHLGSPRINTNANGNVIARHDTMPFGEEIQPANYGSDNLRNRFTSYERDGETGLDYAKARMFGSGVGRFTNPDPTMLSMNGNNPQSFNRYVYVMNNPLLYTDPLGLWEVRYEEVQKDKKNKDGTVTKVFSHYIAKAYKTKGDKDTPAELARQLGLKGKDATNFAKNFTEKGLSNGVELAKMGGDVGRIYGVVQDKLSNQKKYDDKNGRTKKGPGDLSMRDCSTTSTNLAFPNEDIDEGNWGVGASDANIEGKRMRSVAQGDMRIGDIVRYATEGNVPAHFTTFIFQKDNGDPQVFSRSGVSGRFEIGNATDFQNPTYGNISGIGKTDTGFYAK